MNKRAQGDEYAGRSANRAQTYAPGDRVRVLGHFTGTIIFVGPGYVKIQRDDGEGQITAAFRDIARIESLF